jgi:hypothetical protein
MLAQLKPLRGMKLSGFKDKMTRVKLDEERVASGQATEEEAASEYDGYTGTLSANSQGELKREPR